MDEKSTSFKRKYEFQVGGGSKVKLVIEAEIQDMNKNDLEDIIHETAICTHNFYLGLGKEITSSDQ